MFRRICVCILIASPTVALAANKEMQELQRDVAQLQDMVKQLQNSQNEKLAEVRALVQQSLNAAIDANKAVAIIQNGFQQNLRDQEGKVVAPVVGLSNRMDTMSNEFRSLQGAVADLTSMMTKMQDRLTDINNSLKVIQAPAAPPPAQSGAMGAGHPSGPEASPGTPPMSAIDMFTSAESDYQRGHLDIAMEGYSDYLKYYGNTAQAPRAQYRIGYILYSQGDYDKAARAFDALLEKYPHDDPQIPTAAAYYYKGMSLVKAGQKTAAQMEFRELMKQFPTHDLAKQSCTRLVEIGFNCTLPRSAPVRAPVRGKK